MVCRPEEGTLLADRLPTERPATGPDAAPVELAKEPQFRLGGVTVTPTSREIASPDGSRQVLEPRVMQVLVALHRAHGAIVSRDELIRTCWGGTVVGEGSINRAISLLRRAAEEIGGGAFRVETIAKVGYRLVVPGSTAPGEGAPRAPAPARLGLAVLAVLAAAAVVALVLWRPAPEGPAYSVSVVPFETSGAAQGFEEELLSNLSGQDVPISAGIETLTLAGMVEERDGAIRVNARLVAAGTGEVVWSGAIERSPQDAGGIEAAAAAVGSIVQCTLAGANDGGSAIPLDLLAGYARTCELGYRGQSAQGVRIAREITRRAPDFAAGWFALSHHAITLYSRQPNEDAGLRKEALAAAERLIALRPEAQDGYLSKFVVTDPTRTLERERLLRRAMELEPIYFDGAQAYLRDFLLEAGRLEEAFQFSRAVLQQHPEVAGGHGGVFLTAAATGRWRLAEQALERIGQLDTAAMPGLSWRKAVWQQDWAEAERTLPAGHPAQEQAAVAAYRALAAGGPAGKAAAAARVEALPEGCCLGLRVELLTQLGQRGEAIALLDRYASARLPGRRPGLPLLWDPALRPLLYDPAIEPILRRSGWIAYWSETGVVPDVCRNADAPAFCGPLAGN
jgi:DNA-binding winged helix-turn-helix (wHTH) protein